MDKIQYTDWQGFFLVLISICTLVVLISNVIKVIKEAKRPRLSIEDRLNKDHERLTKLEHQNEVMQAEMNLILRTQLALLNHEITGNSVEKLKEMKNEISEYLINRR